MKAWLILVVVALALAPLVQFMPSKGQRRIARMRERAALLGLFVEFRDLPQVGSAGAGTQNAGGNVIYYGRRLAPPRGKASRRAEWLLRGGEWRGRDPKQPLPPELAAIDTPILAAALDDASCGVYWRELGDTAEVEQIAAALVALAARLEQA